VCLDAVAAEDGSEAGAESNAAMWSVVADQPPNIAAMMLEMLHSRGLLSAPRLSPFLAPTLLSLDVSRCRGIGRVLPRIGRECPALMSLRLDYCDASDSQIAAAVSCGSLRSASLRSCQVTSSTVHCLLWRNPQLEVVDIAGCAAVDDEAFASHDTPGWLACLGSLNLSGCRLVSDVALRHLNAAGTLRSLSLKACREVEALPLPSASLTALNMNGVARVPSEDLVVFLEPMIARAVSLKLAECSLRSGDISRLVHRVAGEALLLQKLDLSWCDDVMDGGDGGMNELLSSCPALTSLALRRVNITERTMDVIGTSLNACACALVGRSS
jgi:hypothetical protein